MTSWRLKLLGITRTQKPLPPLIHVAAASSVAGEELSCCHVVKYLTVFYGLEASRGVYWLGV